MEVKRSFGSHFLVYVEMLGCESDVGERYGEFVAVMSRQLVLTVVLVAAVVVVVSVVVVANLAIEYRR